MVGHRVSLEVLHGVVMGSVNFSHNCGQMSGRSQKITNSLLFYFHAPNVSDQPFQIVSFEGNHGQPAELMDSRNHPSD